MANQWFEFKQFRIEQERASFKVGTDGCLLGAWAEIGQAQRILDVGTGTGVIALMLAQRSADTAASIEAIDIDQANAMQAAENFRNAPWSSRLTARCTALQDFKPSQPFELVVCNPPYFAGSTKGDDARKNLARHDDRLTLSQLFHCAYALTTPTASVALVLPIDRWKPAQDAASKLGWVLTKSALLTPRPGKPVHRVLAQWDKQALHTAFVEESWPIYQRSTEYHPRALELLTPFYSSL